MSGSSGCIDLALPGVKLIDQKQGGDAGPLGSLPPVRPAHVQCRDPGDPARGAGAARRRGPGEVRSGRDQGQRCRSRGGSSSISARRIWIRRALATIEVQSYDGHVTLYLADRYHDDAIAFEPALCHPQARRRLGSTSKILEVVPIGGEHIQAIDEPYIAVKVGAYMSEAINRIEAG